MASPQDTSSPPGAQPDSPTQAASPAQAAPTIEPEVDITTDETDSAFGDDSASFTTSLKSSVLNYKYENGRRYHAFGKETYYLPNDENETDRLDLVSHMLTLIIGGELHYAPIGPNPQRILDLGTGTGIWAIDMGDKYPSATVIGNDISPIQPSLVPPNVRFEVDDIEEPWNYEEKFDYIHARYLSGAIKDWPKLMSQAFEYTKPGGWVEFYDFTMNFYTNQGEFKPGCALDKWTAELRAALNMFGCEPEPGPKLNKWVTDAGFTNVTEKLLAIPVGMWPKNKVSKEIGTIHLIQFLEHLEAFSFRAMGARGWSVEEITVFLADVRKDFKNPRFQLQHDGHVVWAQKPLDAE